VSVVAGSSQGEEEGVQGTGEFTAIGQQFFYQPVSTGSGTIATQQINDFAEKVSWFSHNFCKPLQGYFSVSCLLS
jgi:hypothetical protein